VSDSSTLVVTNIKRLLRERGLTQGDLAAKGRISPTLISRYMQGKTVPSLDKLDLIAGALGVPTWELLVEVNSRADIAIGFWESLMRVKDVMAALRRGEPVPPEVQDLESLAKLIAERSDAQETAPPKSPRSANGE
jgi:transcriptional regulator with XRE-family HTH domain